MGSSHAIADYDFSRGARSARLQRGARSRRDAVHCACRDFVRSQDCVDIADFAAANEAELSQIVDLPHGAPSHDSFSRLFRLLDPEEMAEAFARFKAALRAELGLPSAKGVVAVDGKSLRPRLRASGRAFMPPLMISVWDAPRRGCPWRAAMRRAATKWRRPWRR